MTSDRTSWFGPMLLGCSGLLAAMSIVAMLTGGVEFSVFGLARVSARDPMRLLMEAAWIAVFYCGSQFIHGSACHAALLAGALLAYYVGLTGESTPRRVGDGLEYIAMSAQLSSARWPAKEPDRADLLVATLETQSGIADAQGARDVIGTVDDREFIHAWVYPLAVAPALAVARAAGINWNHAFTFVNACLLVALAVLIAGRAPPAIAILFVAGPIIWWLDKAHVEVFTFALLGLGLLFLMTYADRALPALGLLTAQNPAFAAAWLPATLLAWNVSTARRRSLKYALAGAALASSTPLYYAWRTGQAFPLSSLATWDQFSIPAAAIPLFDPLNGLLWYSPWLLIALVCSKADPDRVGRVRLIQWGSVALGVVLCSVFALSGNLNHGGTPGPSRYGVWLMPLFLPWLVAARFEGWRRVALNAVLLLSMAASAVSFHPRLAEDAWRKPAPASWLLEHAPGVYNPLPEIFAERVGLRDGVSSLPVATDNCSKILLRGDGDERALWPFPCRPSQAPPSCTAPGALCYANRRSDGSYAFVTPPRQPSFQVSSTAAELSWRDVDRWSTAPVPIDWLNLRTVPPMSGRSWLRDAEDVKRIRAYQSQEQLLAVVEPYSPDRPGRILLQLAGPFRFWWLNAADVSVVTEEESDGEGWFEAPTSSTYIVLVHTAHPR